MKAVAICGSLRAESSNLFLLQAVITNAPPGIEIELFTGLDTVPAFNADLDEEGAVPPAPVAALRALVGSASGVIVCSPEYAHGVPGALKNALDWLVSSGEFIDKPVLLLNAAPAGGAHAQAALREVIATMSGNVLDASLMRPFLRGRLRDAALDDDPEALTSLRGALAAFGEAVQNYVSAYA
jgi:NAD(P)H-dependent FMN reductase